MVLLATVIYGSSIRAQERWFQIEISIFSNEVLSGRMEEEWEPDKTELDYPENLRRLALLSDLFLAKPVPGNIDIPLEELEQNSLKEALKNIGPKAKANQSDFKLFDFAREAYVQLPMNESDFQQTNQALQRSSDHRLLFHGLWRQAVTQKSSATPILIEGGLSYGNEHELQGSITIRFNQNEDRVVIDTDLWLTEFSIIQNTEENWSLPEIPQHLNHKDIAPTNTLNYFPNKVYHMNQSRDMRSMEFHYLDHPSLGLVILVKPYDIP